MSDHTALILLAGALISLTAALVATAAGYLAHRDHATWPQAVARAATTFAATLTLAAVLTTTLQSLAR
jgi:hypothetical protein